MICNAYNNLGTVVDLLKDPQTALSYHRKALEIAEEIGACLFACVDRVVDPFGRSARGAAAVAVSR